MSTNKFRLEPTPSHFYKSIMAGSIWLAHQLNQLEHTAYLDSSRFVVHTVSGAHRGAGTGSDSGECLILFYNPGETGELSMLEFR